jgi:hypothetical protein
MSWQFPKFTIPNGSVIGVDDFNRGFQEVAGELGGTLNEHNWRLDCLNGGLAGKTGGTAVIAPAVINNGFRDALSQDAAYRWWIPEDQTIAETAARNMVSNVGSKLQLFGPATIDNPVTVLQTYTWSSIMKARIETDTSMLWVLASFQIDNNYAPTNYALRIDGQIVEVSAVATAEYENDVKGQVGYFGDYPITIETMQIVTEGTHTVELCAMEMVLVDNDEAHTTLGSYTDIANSGSVGCVISNRSLIVLEVRS